MEAMVDLYSEALRSERTTTSSAVGAAPQPTRKTDKINPIKQVVFTEIPLKTFEGPQILGPDQPH